LHLEKREVICKPKKCAFITDQVLFWNLLSSQGVSVDSQKVLAIVEWPEPRSIHDVRSFHEVATFYK